MISNTFSFRISKIFRNQTFGHNSNISKIPRWRRRKAQCHQSRDRAMSENAEFLECRSSGNRLCGEQPPRSLSRPLILQKLVKQCPQTRQSARFSLRFSYCFGPNGFRKRNFLKTPTQSHHVEIFCAKLENTWNAHNFWKFRVISQSSKYLKTQCLQQRCCSNLLQIGNSTEFQAVSPISRRMTPSENMNTEKER